MQIHAQKEPQIDPKITKMLNVFNFFLQFYAFFRKSS